MTQDVYRIESASPFNVFTITFVFPLLALKAGLVGAVMDAFRVTKHKCTLGSIRLLVYILVLDMTIQSLRN